MGICRSLMDSSQKRTVTWTFVVSSTNCQIANDLRYFNAHMTSLLCDVIWSQEVMEPFQYKDAVLPILRIPIINIRHSHNCLFFTMEIPMPGRMVFNIPPAQQSCWGGGGGILVSLCPSVRPSRIPCPLCSTYSFGWIHFIFIHLIKQLQEVCRV